MGGYQKPFIVIIVEASQKSIHTDWRKIETKPSAWSMDKINCYSILS